MPKNSFQDFVKINKADKIEKIEKEQILRDFKRPKVESSFSQEILEGRKREGSKYTIWIVALVSIIFLFFAVSFLFSSAKIFVDPKVQNITLDQNFSAVKNVGTSDLTFDLISLNGEENMTVKGGDVQNVESKAVGTVIIYNSYSSSPQTLSINTKLEGSNGKIYKTKTKVIVPGMKSKDLPGSVEVDIYASEAGEEYNNTPQDFKILIFKGTAKYTKFYVRSKGEITGGLKGQFSQISDTDKSNAIEQLKNNLQNKLLKKATDQIPSGYILFKDGAFLETDGGNIGVATPDNLIPVSVSGTLYGFIFNEKELTKKIIADKIQNYNNDDVYIDNLQNLIFSLSNQESISFKDIENINFNLNGNVKIIWNIDKIKLIADLLGKNKSDFSQIMTNYPNISSASLSIKPIWKSSLPDKSDKIDIIINTPK